MWHFFQVIQQFYTFSLCNFCGNHPQHPDGDFCVRASTTHISFRKWKIVVLPNLVYHFILSTDSFFSSTCSSTLFLRPFYTNMSWALWGMYVDPLFQHPPTHSLHIWVSMGAGLDSASAWLRFRCCSSLGGGSEERALNDSFNLMPVLRGLSYFRPPCTTSSSREKTASSLL